MRVRYTEAKRARFYRLALPDAESAEGVTTTPGVSLSVTATTTLVAASA